MLHKFILVLLLTFYGGQACADPTVAATQCPPYRELVPSEVKLIPMSPEDWPIVERTAKFFIYDLAEHMGQDKAWKFPEDGSYECETHPHCTKLSRYVKQPSNVYHPSFIYYKGEMAGFVLVHENPKGKNTAEIFIISKFRNQGLGKYIADMTFKKYPGEWDAQSIGENHASKEIWGAIHAKSEKRILDKSKVKIVLGKQSDLNRIQRMARFFLYDMLEYMRDHPNWYFPESGHYECQSLKDFFVNIGKDNFPYLVYYAGELAGFALVNKKVVSPGTQYNMSEFFIVRKFKGQGLGRYVAEQVYNKHSGIWEVQQMTHNCAAIKFWEKVLSKYTNNKYTRSIKPVPYLNNRVQVIERFDNRVK